MERLNDFLQISLQAAQFSFMIFALKEDAFI